MIREFSHKKEVYQKMLKQEGYTVKSLEVAAQYIYTGLSSQEQEELAALFYSSIEQVFKDLHRDYAGMVLAKLSPAFLGRPQDKAEFEQIVANLGDSNPHFRNSLAVELEALRKIIE